MPAQRTVPPARPVKTERTHEENQERAYIAASRRSDRSLEARVESARRASEIHKRRTGRSLRVTEQDVVNEEMYEEEDDDLPMRFRGIASHLHTNNVEFNRRLQAYLTNQMAMRDTNQLFAEQFPNVPQFPHNQQTIYQTNMLAQQYQQQLMMQQQQQLLHSPTSPSPAGYRQAPYPSPGMQQIGFHPTPVHARSASISTPQASSSAQSPLSPSIKTEAPRRMSMNAINTSGPTDDLASASNPILTPKSADASAPSSQQQYQSQFHQFLPGAPFTTSRPKIESPIFDFGLPTETQQLLGGDPLNSMYAMNQSNFYWPMPYMTTAQPSDLEKVQSYATTSASAFSSDGLNTTLAPDDTSLTLDQSSAFDIDGFGADASNKDTGFGTGTLTPGVNDFSMFINDQDHWGTPNASQ